MILTGWFLLGVGMQTVVTNPSDYALWQRVTWGGVPIAVALWLWTAILLASPDHRLQSWHWLILLYAVVLSLAGVFTDLLFAYQDITRKQGLFEHFRIYARLPAHFFYGCFVLLALLISTVLMFSQYQNRNREFHPRQGFKWLSLGSALVTFGATLSIVGYTYFGKIPEQYGDFVVTIGAALVGYGVANHRALIQHQVIRYDFLHSFLN
jgi:CDP-diglyceride synthetase